MSCRMSYLNTHFAKVNQFLKRFPWATRAIKYPCSLHRKLPILEQPHVPFLSLFFSLLAPQRVPPPGSEVLPAMASSSSSVRFTSGPVPTRSPSSSLSHKQCQTIPVQFTSVGTDPIQRPEKGAQTEAAGGHGLANWGSNVRISERMVEMVEEEVGRVHREQAVLEEFERKLMMGGEEGGGGGGMTLRHIGHVEVPTETNSSISLSALHCGPGPDVALLFGAPQHEANWCNGHLGAQLVVVSTRRRAQIRYIPMPACPSAVLFARHGELIIAGTHSGDLLLFSSNGGQMLWSSASSPTSRHCRAISQLRWAEEKSSDQGRGAEPRELISLGLDGTVKRSRLEADNRLELLQTVEFGLGDLPRELRKSTTNAGTKLGLVDCVLLPSSAANGNAGHGQSLLLIATEIGIVLELDPRSLTLEGAFELGDSAHGIEQIGLARLVGTQHADPLIVWRSSDGLIRHFPFRKQSSTTRLSADEIGILPLQRTRSNFQICFDQLLLGIGMAESGGTMARELIGWDLLKKQMVMREKGPDGEECEGEEGPFIGSNGRDTVVMAVGRRGEGRRVQRLEVYQIVEKDEEI